MIDKEVLEFFNALPPCPTYFYEYYGTDMEYKIEELNLEDKIKINYGCSKFVFIFNNLDYVIKVPMNSFFPCDDYGIEGDEPELFQNGGSRPGDDTNWDYCALEEELSKFSINNNIDAIVLPTTYLGEVNGYRLYKQDKIDTSWLDIVESHNKPKLNAVQTTKINKVRKKYSNYIGLDDYFMFMIMKNFSKNIYNKLFKWLDLYNIEDLHAGNYGIKNGYPVIFDYCGFDN